MFLPDFLKVKIEILGEKKFTVPLGTSHLGTLRIYDGDGEDDT